MAPTLAAPAARSPAPSLFTFIAPFSSASAPSTSVNAAQLTTTSGRCNDIARSIEARSVMSRALWLSPTTS
jgi:hypothetical protein